MKKYLFGAALALAALTACGPGKGELRIKGSVTGFEGDTALLMAESRTDTILMEEGKFDFTAKFDSIEGFLLALPVAGERADYKTFQLLAVPGETLEIEGDLKGDYRLAGSTYYEQYSEAEKALRPSMEALNQFFGSLDKRMREGEAEEVLMQEYMAKAPALQQKITEATMAFIQAHPDYDCSAQLLTTLGDYEEMKKAEALLSERVRNGRMKAYYRSFVDQAEAQLRAEEEEAESQAPGRVAPDFTLNDLNGKPLSLSSFRGRYVLIDFWGSWCGWCIKGFPQLKEYYGKYAGKFEILGVDCRDSDEVWREAVKKYDLPWKHVRNTDDSDVLALYGVRGFPTKILVGPDGKIVKSVVGEDPAFFEVFDELFK